jgi:predicted Ser/Thr protein kinase
MESQNRHGLYRFSSDGDVFYVEAHQTASLSDDDYGFPPAVRRYLTPRPPTCNWADITDGNRVEWRSKQLKGIEECWHPTRIDLRDLEPVKSLTAQVWLCRYQAQLVIAKIARFEFEIPDIERESQVYQIIDSQDIGPPCLGYLMEKGRVMGILLKYVDARPGCVSDLDRCLEVLRKLHGLGILLNDTNKFNFLVADDGQKVFICDFANAELNTNAERLRSEEEGLKESLSDDYYDDNDWADGKDRLESMSVSDYRI